MNKEQFFYLGSSPFLLNLYYLGVGMTVLNSSLTLINLIEKEFVMGGVTSFVTILSGGYTFLNHSLKNGDRKGIESIGLKSLTEI